MKFLFNSFPIILFLITFKSFDDEVKGILAATAVIILATLLQVGYMWLKHRHVEKIHIITLVMVILFGGLTLWFSEPIFLKWKVSLINWLFGLILLVSQFIGDKPLLKRMLANNITMPDIIWSRLNMAWSLFFFSLGFANLYIAFSFSLDTWVNFKTYGILGTTFLFLILQAFYIARFVEVTSNLEND